MFPLRITFAGQASRAHITALPGQNAGFWEKP